MADHVGEGPASALGFGPDAFMKLGIEPDALLDAGLGAMTLGGGWFVALGAEVYHGMCFQFRPDRIFLIVDSPTLYQSANS